MKATVLKFAAVAFLVAGLVLAFRLGDDPPAERDQPIVGNVRTLQAAYDRWKADYTRNGGDRKLTLGLGYSKGLSAQFTKAHGQATLDLVDGSLSVEVSGLSDREAFDVWLIDNRPGPGRSVKPEPGDGMMRVGSLKHGRGTATLQARLGREVLAGFEIDLLLIARAGEAPGAAGLLFASPSLFQRVYYNEQQRQTAEPGEPATPSLFAAPFQVLVPRPAFAQTSGPALDPALVARGEDLFFNETFNGNGRTCGTCHPADNNLTIDPAFIATLPPNDPLFVAEQNNRFPGLAKNFENPVLMRRFGLILENVDGFDRPGVMRGVPHTLALSESMRTPDFDDLIPPTNDVPPAQRTGWSGDGAPGEGTLREFATGAVKQHFTRTLARDENKLPVPDFRLPTDGELDAMEAFQLSLGRDADLNLSALTLKGDAELGKGLFTTKQCAACHSNAGANAFIEVPGLPFPFTGNANFDTGVENLLPDPADNTGQRRPRDGGFGRTLNGDGSCSTPTGCKGGFGNGTFNTPPLVEAADTGPFFHNNAVRTIEEAVAFYNDTEFNTSPASFFVKIALQDAEIRQIGAFLRVINALENIRSSTEVLRRAQAPLTRAKTRELLRLSTAEIDDAIRVLREKGLHPDGVTYLRIARTFNEIASQIAIRQIRNIYIGLAIRFHEVARDTMVVKG